MPPRSQGSQVTMERHKMERALAWEAMPSNLGSDAEQRGTERQAPKMDNPHAVNVKHKRQLVQQRVCGYKSVCAAHAQSHERGNCERTP
jgi:hypothetical protein